MQLCELHFQDPATKTYLGSPSLVRLPDGRILATHDYFGPGCPRNHEDEEHLTSVYRSEDNGCTWRNLTHIANAFWSSLFVHRGAVYLLGCSQQYGSIVIRRSEDGGNTWSHPKDDRTGLLFRGGKYHNPPNYHCAPTPILISGGRLYRAFENCDPCRWPTGFRACVISCCEDFDLLAAANWSMSNNLAFDPAWIPTTWGRMENPGWLEGNIIQAPDGRLVNLLRFNSDPLADKAAIVSVLDEGRRLSFDSATGFIDFPGGMSKFTIRLDGGSGLYLTLSNPVAGSTVSRARKHLNMSSDMSALQSRFFEPVHDSTDQRNILALCVSSDLREWRIKRILLWDDSGLDGERSRLLTGFHYVDWQFDGNDIIYLVRTAYEGAHNLHDSNRITFHRLERYCDYILPDRAKESIDFHNPVLKA